MKTIWLINQHVTPPEQGHFNRHYYFAKYLKQFGYNPIVFAGSNPHNTDKQLIIGKSRFMYLEGCDFQFVYVKTCVYLKSRFKRLYAMFQFVTNLFLISGKFDKPDVIIGSSGHLFNAIMAIISAKKYRCKAIVEVRDLWPESLVSYGIIKQNSLISKFLYKIEKWLYKTSDSIIFTMEGGKDYILCKGWDKEINCEKINYINNGVDYQQFEFDKNYYRLSDEDLDNPDIFKVVYTGSIRLVNNVNMLIDTAIKISVLNRAENKKIKILVWGYGEELDNLKERCATENVTNIVFKGAVAKQYIPSILSRADITLLHYFDASVGKYGGSQNKLFEYLAAGRPIVSTITNDYCIIKKYECGTITKNDPDSIARCLIGYLVGDPAIYEKHAKNAFELSQFFDYKSLTRILIDLIKK